MTGFFDTFKDNFLFSVNSFLCFGNNLCYFFNRFRKDKIFIKTNGNTPWLQSGEDPLIVLF